MRYLYLFLSFLTFLLIIIIYFQNLAGAYPTMMYFLTLSGTTSPSWAILIAFFGGIVCATFLFLFMTGGKVDIQTMIQGKKEGEETGEWQ